VTLDLARPMTDTHHMRTLALTMILAATAAPPADSQQADPDADPSALRLERVEQGFEDVSPLAHSLERFAPEFRAPSGFDAVYRVPGEPDLLMRQSGAVRAVFGRSEYTQTRFGLRADVPAGAIYTIGEPPEYLLGSLRGGVLRAEDGPRTLTGQPASRPERRPGLQSAAASPLRVSGRLEPGETPRTEPRHRPDLDPARERPSVWTSELMRQRRLESLLAALTTEEDSSAPADPAEE